MSSSSDLNSLSNIATVLCSVHSHVPAGEPAAWEVRSEHKSVNRPMRHFRNVHTRAHTYTHLLSQVVLSTVTSSIFGK